MKSHRLWVYTANTNFWFIVREGVGFVLIKAFDFQIQDKMYLISGEIFNEGDSVYLRSSVNGTVCKSKLVILDNTIYLFFPVRFLSLLSQV